MNNKSRLIFLGVDDIHCGNGFQHFEFSGPTAGVY